MRKMLEVRKTVMASSCTAYSIFYLFLSHYPYLPNPRDILNGRQIKHLACVLIYYHYTFW